MPGIIFLILGILLKILLAVILIIVVLLLIFLLVPLCYKIYIGKDDAVRVRVDGSWLLRLVRGAVRLDSSSPNGMKPHIWFKAAWLTLYDNEESAGSQDDKSDTDAPSPGQEPPQEPAAESSDMPEEETVPGSAQTGTDDADVETAGEPQEVPLITQSEDENSESGEGSESSEGSEEDAPVKKSLREKIREKADSLHQLADDLSEKIARILDALLDLPEKVWDKADAISDKVDGIWDKADSLITRRDKIIAILEDERCSRYICKCLKQLRKILIYLRPGIDFLHLHFGFDDPSLTGKVLGYLSFLYPANEDRMTVIPEFEETVLEGEAQFSGKIRIGRLVWYMLPVVLDPCFFRLIKQIRKL